MVKYKKKRNKTKYFVGLLFIFLSLLLFSNCSKLPETKGESGATIALYADQGADEDCLKASLNMFQWMGYSVKYVTAYSINTQGLDNYKILCIPGGDMYHYGHDLSSAGKENIKNFIRNGGGYIGICGGAYFTGEKVYWQGNQLPMTPLGIFPGTTRGPEDEIVPYPNYGMCRVDIVDSLHPITESEPDTTWILYYWGPVFIPNTNAEIDILARYNIGNEAAIVTFNYDSGRVFIIGPHPEFEEDSERDGTSFADELDDKGSDWDLMKKATMWCLKELD